MSLREQLEAIRARHGELTPELVVLEATDPEHPLHDRFTWDDGVAGARWRREEAHQLIQMVRVVYREGPGKVADRSVRAFQAVRRTDKGPVYEPVDVVAADPFLRKLVLADMQREWLTLKRRYDGFVEFTEMVRADFSDGAA